MKRFPKLIVTLLLLAMVIGIYAAIPVAAANEYDALRLKSSHLTVGHYATTAMDGEIVQHSANKNYKEEITCLVDNSNSNGYWSKPYKFKDLKDEGGSIIPVILIDVAAVGNGSPVAIAGFDLRLRNSFDCRPLHVVLQVTTSEGSNSWTTVADKKFSSSDWDASPKQRIEFNETTAYKFRALFYNIGDADVAADAYKDYEVVKGDETRLALTEIDLLTIRVGGSDSTGGTTNPTTGGNTQTPATRPSINIPTRPGTTTAPTQPATKAPTQAATQAPTKAPNQPATQPATKAPTQAATQAPTKAPRQTTTVAPTQPATQTGTTAPTTATAAPTEPTGTVDPSAPTEPTGTVDPSAPTEETVDPSAPTEEPTVAPTDEPTVAPTVETTEPQATTGTTDSGTEETPKDFPWVIVVIIAAAAVVAGGAVFFIIKKKKQG